MCGLEQDGATRFCPDCGADMREGGRMSEITENEIKSMTKEQNYMRGYRDGKSDVLDKIRADIIMYEGDCRLSVDEYPSCKQCTDNVFETIYGILDKCKAESEDEE